MKQFKKTIMMFLLWGICGMAHAQSMYWAKKYYEEGKYLEAAKQLRPLADGGNAEAQYMAAKLFFNGQGVQASETQGIKYATLAADQGYEQAIELIVNKFAKKGDNRTYTIAKKYTDKHPYLKKGIVGWIMAAGLIDGKLGAAKDEDTGWKMLEENDNFKKWIKEYNNAKIYWEYKARKAGKNSIDELAEHYYNIGSKDNFNKVDTCLIHLYNTEEALKTRADSGSVWAMNQLSNVYYKRGDKPTALQWAKKAKDGGSSRGRMMEERLSFVSFTCNKISIGSLHDRRYGIESIDFDYDRITIHYYMKNTSSTWIANGSKKYLRYGGKYYKTLASSLPTYPKTKSITPGQIFRFTDTYYRTPNTIPTPFDIIENGTVLYEGVQIMDKPTITTTSKTSTSTAPATPSIKEENQAYIYDGTKDHLITMGMIDKSCNVINVEKIKHYAKVYDKTKSIDIRIYKRKGGKSARLLTIHPEESYTIDGNSKYVAGILHITNPQLFWSQNDFAIIIIE